MLRCVTVNVPPRTRPRTAKECPCSAFAGRDGNDFASISVYPSSLRRASNSCLFMELSSLSRQVHHSARGWHCEGTSDQRPRGVGAWHLELRCDQVHARTSIHWPDGAIPVGCVRLAPVTGQGEPGRARERESTPSIASDCARRTGGRPVFSCRPSCARPPN